MTSAPFPDTATDAFDPHKTNKGFGKDPSATQPVSLPMPALYLSHGAPTFALSAGTTGPALTHWGAALRREWPALRGVLIMSPHWIAPSARVGTGALPETWHDFGGFPPELYALRYPAKGAPELAEQVLGLLRGAGIAAQGDAARPFDHGAWVPLRHLFPEAEVPVVQMALPQQAGPAEVLAMGAAVQSLRSENVLVVGSGSMTHNLHERPVPGAHAAPYVLAFRDWMEAAIARGDIPALLDYRRRAPDAVRAHPTEEHLLPLFFALGAAGANARPDYLSREVMYGHLSMDAFALSA